MTVELTKRKCIWRKVKSAWNRKELDQKTRRLYVTWRMGWAMTMSSTQFLLFMVACIAISRPLKMSVPRPNTTEEVVIAE